MSIPTQMCLVGSFASTPSFEFAASGTERARAQVGVEHRHTQPDRSRTALEPTFHPIVAYGPTARQVYAHFRRGDHVMAGGYIVQHEPETADPNDPREVFVATDIGHHVDKTDHAIRRPRHQAAQAQPTPAVQPPAGVGL